MNAGTILLFIHNSSVQDIKPVSEQNFPCMKGYFRSNPLFRYFQSICSSQYSVVPFNGISAYRSSRIARPGSGALRTLARQGQLNDMLTHDIGSGGGDGNGGGDIPELAKTLWLNHRVFEKS